MKKNTDRVKIGIRQFQLIFVIEQQLTWNHMVQSFLMLFYALKTQIQAVKQHLSCPRDCHTFLNKPDPHTEIQRLTLKLSTKADDLAVQRILAVLCESILPRNRIGPENNQKLMLLSRIKNVLTIFRQDFHQ